MVEIRRTCRLVSAAAVALSAACASAASRPAAPIVPEPRALSPAAVETAIDLLRLEDLREYREPIIDGAAAAADPAVRARAALAAGRIDAPESFDLVERLLEDPDTAVLAAAAFSAGLLGDEEAVPDLISLLDTANAIVRPTVAVEAAEALGQIATDAARDALVEFLEVADTADLRLRSAVGAAIVAAARIDEDSTDPFERWLTVADPKIRWRAMYALTRTLRPEVVPRLLSQLDDAEPLVRAFALRGLVYPAVEASDAAADEVLPELLEAVADSAYVVRIEAIRALGSYEDPAAVQALRGLLVDAPPHARVAAIESLGRLGPTAGEAMDDLGALAENLAVPAFIRGTTITALTSIDPAGEVALLRRFMHDPEWRVRVTVARTLATRGPAALSSLEDLARDPDPRVAAAAIEASIDAAGIGSIAMLRPLLLESLQSPDVQVRAAALRGFSWLADLTTYPALLDAYEVAREDAVDDAALAAIDAIAELGLVGMPAPERAFFARFDRPDDFRQRERAIARFGDAAREAWGAVAPIETRATTDDYRRYVQGWIAPAPDERDLPRVRIITDEGAIDLLLFADDAPLTVANFLDLARAGFFDGQQWARAVPNFVVQGGDPRGDMSGGPGYTIRDEPNRNRFETGSVGMALSGADSGGSQFFITESPQPDLDGDYTVFGQVIAGLEVAERVLPGQTILSIRQITEVD